MMRSGRDIGGFYALELKGIMTANQKRDKVMRYVVSRRRWLERPNWATNMRYPSNDNGLI